LVYSKRRAFIDRSLKELKQNLNDFTLQEGKNTTALPFFNIYRFTTQNIPLPENSKSYLYLIVNGVLRLHTISGILDYIPGQYSVSTIDSPLSGQFLTVSRDSEFCAIEIELSLDDVISIMLDMNEQLTDKIFASEISQRVMSGFDTNLIYAVTKLIKSMRQPDTLHFMGNT